MRVKLVTVLVGLTMITGWAAPSPAILQRLSPEQIVEAIKYGKSHVQTDPLELLREWGVGLGPDKGDAIIITEFLALALAARQFAARGEELSPLNIEDAVARSSGKLVFRVSTYGNKVEFAKEYTADLKPGEKTIPATFWTNGVGEAYGDGISQPAFVVDSDFFFPAAGIAPDSSITLIVKDKDGKAVAEFKFDLAKIR